MARETTGPSGLNEVLYRLGYTGARIQGVIDDLRETAASLGNDGPDAAAAAPRRDDAPRPETPREDGAAGGLGGPLGSLVATTAAGALLAQVLRPRRVNWPRAVLAGTIGTLMYDVETVVDARRLGRNFGTRAALRRLLLSADLRTQLGRLAAGIGMAGFYAGFLHGRLPGPPLLQGLLFGALESGTRRWGGSAALFGRLAPEIPIPAAYTRGIERGDETTPERIRRHLVFGLVVGLVYRGKGDGDG
jgi:hypothetical protein